MRLDIELTNKNLFESRNKAQNAIKSGIVYVNDKKITQCGFSVTEDDKIDIKGNSLKYVSKGGLKLEKIIKIANIDLNGKTIIDVGASTGGFTDCALQYGAEKVYTIDVGTSQLHSSLKSNSKVICFEETDFRNIDVNNFTDVTMATTDVSFISSTKLIPKFCEFKNLNEILLLIKPQFECGKEIADKYKGIIENKDIHFNILEKTISEYKKFGFTCICLTFSPIKGSKGNIEYIAYFKKSDKNLNIDIRNIVKSGFDKLNINRKKFYRK